MTVGKGAASHQRRDDGDAGQLGERPQRRRAAGLEDPAAGVDHRSLGGGDELGGGGDERQIRRRGRAVARHVQALGPVPLHRLQGDVLRHVHEDRTWPAGCRHVEGFGNHAGDVGGVGDEPVVLRDTHRDAGRVGLLEGVGADRRRRHLPGDADEGDRVHVGIAQRRDDVRRARAARDDRHARPARDVRVTLCHVARPLLVAHEDVADRRVDDGVVYGQDASTGEAEHDLDALGLKAFHEGLCSGQLHGR